MSWEILKDGALVLLGFILAMGWDLWKTWRENKARDESISRVTRNDLTSNQSRLVNISGILQHELAVLAKKQSVVGPLPELMEGFWTIVEYNPPSKLLKSGRLEQLHKIHFYTTLINHEIRSRENYRIANGAMTNYSDRMRAYDESLQQKISVLNDKIKEYLGRSA